MNENDLERSLRAWHRARVDANERAPMPLRASLADIPQVAPAPHRFFQRPGLGLLVAALLGALLLGGAIGFGTGVIRLPALVIVSRSPRESASETPVETARPAGWTVTGAMTEARAWHTSTLLADGRVLVAGGTPAAGSSWLDSAEIYDPTTRSWTATNSMPAPISAPTATRLADGRVLIVSGGGDKYTRVPETPSAELYDPVTETWSATGSLRNFVGEHSAVLLADGRVLVVGNGGAELYDPASGNWTVTGSLSGRGEYYVALLQDERVLVAAGAAVELLDPVSSTWTPTGGMTTSNSRSGAAGILLSDGRFLVSGGFPTHGSPGAELYDPATGTWSVTGGMLTPRYAHRLVRLVDGEILAVGGLSPLSTDASPTGSAELYAPATGAWTETEFLKEARFGLTATLLDDGTVLVAGGQSSRDGPALSSAELFVAGSN